MLPVSVRYTDAPRQEEPSPVDAMSGAADAPCPKCFPELLKAARFDASYCWLRSVVGWCTSLLLLTYTLVSPLCRWLGSVRGKQAPEELTDTHQLLPWLAKPAKADLWCKQTRVDMVVSGMRVSRA
jgi:hypothetical protein